MQQVLSAQTAQELDQRGFALIRDLMTEDAIGHLPDEYDAAVAAAAPGDIRIGSTTTRVADFVNRGEAFEKLYVEPSLLAAASQVIGRPFKLSTLHARTVRPHSAAMSLHVDVQRDSADWPLLGFIVMIDPFTSDNGATRFVPGSHRRLDAIESAANLDSIQTVMACGAAGSMIIFNGSVWHGASANTTNLPRRSLQGAFIPRSGKAATDFAARMHPQTRQRLSAEARYVLAI